MIRVAIYLSHQSILKYNEYSGTIRYHQGTYFRIIPVYALWLLPLFVFPALESDGIPDNHIRMRARMPAFRLGSLSRDHLLIFGEKLVEIQ